MHAPELAAVVAAELGVAIVPRLVVIPGNRDVVLLLFGSRIPPRTIVLAWRRDRYRSAAAEALVELATELGADCETATARPSASAASSAPRRGR